MTKKTGTKSGTENILNYIEHLVKMPSPTGFTRPVVDFLKANAEKKGIDFYITRKGAIIYKFGPVKAEKSIMLAVHIDTLGAIVKKVEKKSVKFDIIGGFPPEYIVGNNCSVHTFDGKIIPGTIMHRNPAVHVNKDLGDKKFKIDDLEVRVDIKLKNDKDSFEKYIETGNFISFDPGYQVVNGFVKSRHLDDKASAGILLELADELLVTKKKLKTNVYMFFNVTEETGQGIAGYPDIDDFLAIDMGAVGDGLAGDEFHVSICAKDSTGPYHYEFTQELVKLSKKGKIPYKIDIFPRYGSDGSGALRSGRDIRVALIGPGVAASHGYERTHVDALDGVAKLVRAYIKC